MHGLLLAEAKMHTFCRVFTADTDAIILRIILEAFDLQGARESFVFCFYKLICFLLNSSLTNSSNIIINIHQVVEIPNIV